MDCFFINLARQTDRRERIAENFERHAGLGWALNRVEAVNTDDVAQWKTPGRIAPAEKACVLSHRRALDAAQADPRPVMILEDDTTFGPRSCAVIDRCVSQLAGVDWDMMFTDVCVPEAADMLALLEGRRQFERTGQLTLIDAANINVSGSSAYVVNGASKRKLLALIDEAGALEWPFDLFLQRLIKGGQVRALIMFPFPTSLCEFADSSTIQDMTPLAPDRIWNMYRRLIWLDRDLSGAAEAVAQIGAAFIDDEARLFGTLLASMVSSRFQRKVIFRPG